MAIEAMSSVALDLGDKSPSVTAVKVDITALGTRWFATPSQRAEGFMVAITESSTMPTTLEMLTAYTTSDGTPGSDPTADQIIDLGDLTAGSQAVATSAPIIGFRATGGSADVDIYMWPLK